MIDFTPFPNIQTKNLILRKMNDSDIMDLFEMRKDPRMNEFTDTKLEENTDETKAYIDKMNKGVGENRWIVWAIEHKLSNKVIGSICIWNIDFEVYNGELGYGIIPDFQGQGLMKEVLLKVVEYGFDVMGLKELYAYTEENNRKSIRLLENCNFVEVNRVDDEGYFSKRIYHMVVFRMTNLRTGTLSSANNN